MPENSSQTLNWNSPDGILLEKFIDNLPQDRPIVVCVFGYTSLQMRFDPSLLNRDVVMFASEDLTDYLDQINFDEGNEIPRLRLVPANYFIANLSWGDRATKTVFGNVTVYIAGVIDVLVDRLTRRQDRRDLAVYYLVRAKTGGPSEVELKQALRSVVDMYRPAFDEENPGGDPIANTRRLWQHLYGHDIDVRAEIIRPAIEVRKEAYGENAPDRRAILREIAEESPVYGSSAAL